MHILLANPRGFCAGVKRAISIVEKVLKLYGIPIYVHHEVVHNRYVINKLSLQGAIFIERIMDVPDNSVLIFSAHGVSKMVRFEAYNRNLIIFDATCPLVTKVHMEVARASYKGIETILIGHSGHPEVKGTMGQYTNSIGGIYLVESEDDVWQLKVKNTNNLCFVTQTTLSIEDTNIIINALRIRFPSIIGPHKSDICYATTNRQEAVLNLVAKVDLILVVGSETSSNSNRLAELAKKSGKPVYLIDNAKDLRKEWFVFKKNITVGITAGASAPDILVQQIIASLRLLYSGSIFIEELVGYKENIFFEIPENLFKSHNISS